MFQSSGVVYNYLIQLSDTIPDHLDLIRSRDIHKEFVHASDCRMNAKGVLLNCQSFSTYLNFEPTSVIGSLL